ncbi:MAG TPA: hypothetical protein VFE37_04725 [Chloroflexota bacterium]|nr:hypothetical protein [Chloroflexota bacterium]
MRYLLLSLLAGSLMLQGAHQIPATPSVTPGLSRMAPVSYAQGPLDNPAEPGDAFPSGPFAGGTG